MTQGTAGPTDIEAILSRADPALGRVIERVITTIGRQRITPSRAVPFEALVRAIVYQSVSGKAAAVIFKRLKDRVTGAMTADRMLMLQPEDIVAVGLSKAKATYVHNLAEWFSANPEAAKTLPDLPDDDVVRMLTGISGIGAWTANVFLIFNLGRMDVLPANDLGIRRGVQLVCGLHSVATPKQVHERAALWQPYRSIASIYLWNAVKLGIGPGDLN